MPPGHEVSDFVTVARQSVERALFGRTTPVVPRDRLIAALERADEGRPLNHDAHFIAALVAGGTFRQAAHLSGLRRGEAKRLVIEVGETCARFRQATAPFESVPLRLESQWAFQAKDRGGAPAKRKLDGVDAVWTHVWIDEATAFAAMWRVGPHVVVATAADEPIGIPTSWLAGLSPGFARKVRAHAAVVGLSLVHHNYCRCRAGGEATPAMAAGLTDGRWSIDDLVGRVRGRQP